MLRTTLRQARGTAGRLAAAGTAIVLGTAFVAAVLLASGLFHRTVVAAVSASYAGADVVVTAAGQDRLDDAALDRIRAVPGAAGADGRVDGGVQLLSGARSEYAPLANVPSVPALRTSEVLRGELPSAPGEVALSAPLAERLRVPVGGQLLVRTYPPDAGLGADGAPVPRDVPVTVSAVLAGGTDSALGSSGTVLAGTADALAWTGSEPGAGAYGSVLVVAQPGTSPQQLRAAVARAQAGTDTVVQTADARAAQTVDAVLGGADVLTGIVLAFAVLALFVAGIVITNTFSVLVAQRTRQLALLRCVGATSGQVRRSVLGEALVLGLGASLVGVAVGTGLAAAAAALLARAATGVPVPGTVTPTLASVGAPVLLGVLATVLAALAPARAATRVAPLAALRPAEAPDLRTRTSRLRLAAAAALVVVGAACLAGGVLLAGQGSTAGVLVALPGGALSFLGVLLGAVLVVPRTVGALGRLAAGVGGGPARVAAANAVRNPRRTATTTSALLIGVTLVTLMTVGAASTQRTLDAALDEQFPVDVAVGADSPGPEALSGPTAEDPAAAPATSAPGALPAALPAAVRAVDGVAAVVPLRSARATATTGSGRYAVTLRGVDPDRGRSVVADPAALAPLAAGVAVVPRTTAEALAVADGQRLTVAVGGASRTLTARVTPLGGDAVVVPAADLAALAPSAATSRLWVSLEDGADAAAVVEDVRQAVGDAAGGSDAVPVEGSAVQRAGYQRVIDTMLLVVVALLGVAVVIALVGVANTLSLSVIERTRESALLRALGLTRGQLRGMLALEGALVAGVGGLLGVVLGTVYGWAGAASLLGGAQGVDGSTTLALPWARVGLVLAVAVAAGLLASVLPGRRAARTPPVAALAE